MRPFPVGRWDVARHLHSSTTEPGFSYSFAGGFLEDPFAFDPSLFGLSPRESSQMDPQQRLLLEVVWEALENAHIPPSSLAGTEVGVYVGASSLDHGNLHAADPASIDSYFMTGNTLSVVANRISYVYDLRGPSFTVDTACSSSMVALAQALGDLRSGRVETAIVAGVNILLSPASYVGFSRASMLSPTGLCRSFSAEGDGYVRAEGAVSLVLQRASAARPGSIRALVEAAGVNSDGRTSGIALPGLDGQIALLERVYGDLGLKPDDIAFVEAHGTGTRVGDPIEATAIGRVLGRGRARPLPIGSVKSNIGHLEPAAGVAGILKALHALETRRLPATLHIDELNPLIDFEGLNLAPARTPVDLDPKAKSLVCGISSFGFGGTNAHVVLRSAPPATVAAPQASASHLVISAAGRESLRASVAAHADLLAAGVAPDRLATAVATGRDLLKHRAVLALDEGRNAEAALRAFLETGKDEAVVEGTAPVRAAKVCFVYSGNGAQWVGMGRTAFARNAAFRGRFEEIDGVSIALSGRSLVTDLHRADLAEQLQFGAFVQPLIFAIQSATTVALVAAGIRPDVVLGHSVGELGAADAAGCLSIEDCLKIVEARSGCQEAVHGLGTMAVFAADRQSVATLLADLGRDDVEIAADNGPTSITLSGSVEGIKEATRAGRRRRMASRTLDLKYPFHSRFLEGLRERMLEALGPITTKPSRVALISTVTGEPIDRSDLGPEHWWSNVREPVLFRQAVAKAAETGAQLFIEIGPRPILVSPITDTLREIGADARVIATLAESDDRDETADPIARIVARAIANGADAGSRDDHAPIDRSIGLPHYCWHRSDYRFVETSERLDVFGNAPHHPLIGSRLAQGLHEWRTLLDARIVPYLADHVVDGEIVVPGAALVEMLLAVARELGAEGPVGFEDFDILVPLVLPREGMREISIRHTETTGFVEIWSRPRLGPDEWSLHARGRLIPIASTARLGIDPRPETIDTAAAIYAAASAARIDYGPAFRLATEATRDAVMMDVRLAPLPGQGTGHFTRLQLLHPTVLDAALHPLFALAEVDPLSHATHLPVRIARFALYRDHAAVATARLRVDRETADSLTVSIWLRDAEGEIVAEAQGLLLRSVVMGRSDAEDIHFHVAEKRCGRRGAALDVAGAMIETVGSIDPSAADDGWLMLRAHMRAVAHRALLGRTDEDRRFDPETAGAAGRLAPVAVALAATLAEELVSGGLAERDDPAIVIAPSSGLPDPDVILATFAAEFPGSTAELLLAARTAAELEGFLSEGRAIQHRPTVLEQFEASHRLGIAARRAVALALSGLLERADGIAPRILIAEPGHRGVLAEFMTSARRGTSTITVAGVDRSRLERVTARLAVGSGIATLELREGTPDAVPAFDLAVFHAFRTDGEESELFGRIAARVADGGAILVIRPPCDPLLDFYFGTEADWFARSLDASLPIGRIATVSETRDDLERAGLTDITEISLGEDVGSVLIARIPARDVSATVTAPLRIAPAAPSLDALVAAISAESAAVAVVSPPAADARIEHLCLVPQGHGDDRIRTESAIALIRRTLAEDADIEPMPRLRVVIRSGRGRDTDPVGEAVRDFLRVVLNEHAACDLRLLDVDPSLDDATAARRIVEWLSRHDGERETAVDGGGFSVVRVKRGLPIAEAAKSRPEAMELSFPHRGALEHFSWQPKPRRTPEADEIEIEVVATGLNFRDIMLAMGLLDDDVLDDGMAGSVYGLECVGRVVRVGREVVDRRSGDMVFGVAANAFATHVTAPSAGFVPVPAGIEPEATAGLSVAFLTAWYGLVELARLKKGESVLIHGAAGGVGLAAIQIARARGARVIATVSTPDKRALAELFGAEIVHDSRSLAFAEAIRADLGGVDVVLNSLSGDAMRAGIKCLKPFGRFVELGKRDYVANSELGLRPFRRNLTYFGVDVDQLLTHDPATVGRGLEDIVAGFEDGRYTAIPYRLFRAVEIGEAFRLMQGAGHVGRIVIRPPDLTDVSLAVARTDVFSPGPGVHLVVGGTGGFGFATAIWLAETGAKRIVVASRRGRVEPESEANIEALRGRGIDIAVETVDATDAASVEGLIARVTASRGPITGVWFTAMVLDDGLLDGLDEARISRVLAPKIDGADNLDRATRGQPIEQFVMFSSASALVGTPGQAAYAAANGWLQGLARRRRAEGLPALAVGWGAIADVGVLARDGQTAKKLERVTGVHGLSSKEALHRLGRLLVLGDDLADPVVHCARFQKVGAMRELTILQSPAFEDLFGADTASADEAETDLAALIAGKSDAEAQLILGNLIAGEVARILRLSASEVDLGRPLSELGLDSLMALELRMNVETKFHVELPLVAITSVKNLHDLARRMLQTLRGGNEDNADKTDASASSLVAMHGGDEEAFVGLAVEIEAMRSRAEISQ